MTREEYNRRRRAKYDAAKERIRKQLYRRNNPQRWREVRRNAYYRSLQKARKQSLGYYYSNRDSWRASRLLSHAKMRAKRFGLEFSLTKEWVQIRLDGGICEATGLKIDLGYSPNGFFTPSIDRIKPKDGYTPENCRLVIRAFNVAKGPWTDHDLLVLARALISRANPQEDITRIAA